MSPIRRQRMSRKKKGEVRMARSQGSGRTKSLGMGILGMADMVTGDGRYIRALKKEERRARDEGFAQPRLMLVIPFDYYSSL